MSELLEVVASWPSLLLVLLVFGFAPGFCLRLIVLAYPRDDPHRKELVVELYAVPRIQRPLWVAEQLEKVEATVTEISQEDVALAELVREAQASAAVAEQQLRGGPIDELPVDDRVGSAVPGG